MGDGNIDKFIRVLRELGFTTYESKVLACLSLRREALKVSELSMMTDLPRTKVYSVISSLNEEGFVKVHSGRPLKVSAPSPNEMASLLAERVIENARARLNVISRLYSLNLDEGLWIFERSIIPVRGENVISKMARIIINSAKERINLVISEKNVNLIPKLPNIDIRAVLETPSIQSRLGIPKVNCRVVGKHGIFMISNERACILSDEGLKSGVYASEGPLLSALLNLFRGLYNSGSPVIS
jgi:sugar-specific transcriptional regulator TrmB